MLQRAASNAYSWWWASHIRTKQSKWMDQNLQDMEEKVQAMLKLIEEDGDSFARRAEMYYKRRPELIHFVEESYRAYRALAERYDHISKELQNANNTIASVCPEQVQFAMEAEEAYARSRFSKKTPQVSKENIPKVPKDVKSTFTPATNKLQSKKSVKKSSAIVAKSGLSKSEGLKEIDRQQKEILALQTEKEFVKSSYESGLEKYWEIDEKIQEMHDKVCALQNEFGAGTVIEDDEARELMASAALKSCHETLAKLEEKQEKSAEEAVIESNRISDAREKLKSLKDEFLHGEVNQEKPKAKDQFTKAVRELKSSDKEPSTVTQERKDLELLRLKIKEHLVLEPNASLTVTELAEQIDELVNKVISLEAAVSLQTALIQRLRIETDELQAQIGILADDKATLINEKNDLKGKLTEMEEKLLGLQELNRNVQDQNNNLQTHFTEAHCNLDHISEKVHDVKPDNELQATPQTEKRSPVEVELQQEVKRQGGAQNSNDGRHELQKIKSEEKSKALSKDDLHEPEKLNSQDEPKVSGKPQVRRQEVDVDLDDSPNISHEEVKRKEGALNANDELHEPHKSNLEEEQKVSGKDKPQKELGRQTVALNLDDSPNESHQEVKIQEDAGAPNANDDLREPQKSNLEEEQKVSGKDKPQKALGRQTVALNLDDSPNESHQEVKIQEDAGAPNANDDLHEPQKSNLEEEQKVSGKDKPQKELGRQTVALNLDDSPNESHQEVKIQEDAVALNANDDLHEPQNLNSEEEQKASGKGKLQKKFSRQAVSLNIDDSPNESHQEVKREEGPGALNANDDHHEPQNLNSEEEQKVSAKPQKKLRRQAVSPNLDNSPNESHQEVKRQEGAGAMNANDDLHELQNLNSEEEQNISDKPQKKLRRKVVALNPDDIPKESQNVEPKEELKVPASLQKEKKVSAEVNAQAELEDREEKEEHRTPESMRKEKEFYAEVNLQVEFKGQEEKLNPEDLKDSGRSHEEYRGQGSVLSPRGSLDEPQNVKPYGEIEVSVSSQKEKTTDEKEIKEHLSNSKKNLGEEASLPQKSNEPDAPVKKSHDTNLGENFDRQDSRKAVDNLHVETQKQTTGQDDEPDWKDLFMNGMNDREKVLLSQYTAILRNCKEMKKRLGEVDNKSVDGLFDTAALLQELRSDNAKKDEQIKILRQKLSLLQTGLSENESEKSTLTECPTIEREVIYDVRLIMAEEPEISPIEKKFRMSIDELLEENLEFWFRFSSTMYQIQKFETEIKDLQSDTSKLEEKKQQDGSTNAKYSLKSDAKPLYKHLREIHTELGVWLEKSALLKDELKSRFSSLCDIQEEITAALKESAEDDDFKFTSYQAAKFQGEILNMKQENNKVADELQAGLDHVTTLQLEVERALENLDEEFKLSGSKTRQNYQLEHSDSRSGVPLRSFIFGTKPKKPKHSIFSYVHPVLQKKYNGLKTG
ncbi:hypothetical protein MANES_13G100200v8 [Manihot esculenta]|uniref:Uncharacterized protein n=1 Tax=Manihot esculenta TaxID=3983 RepID=A0ACB7GLH4_MANES|nr:hypothetical protein MANES_13G100200v8 [Manihot esculenta]